MSAPPRKPNARVAPGASGGSGQQRQTKPSGHRPEFQEKAGNERNGSQPAPAWPELPGERAMRLLERLWGRR